MSIEAEVEVTDPKNIELVVIDQGKESIEIEPTSEELNTLKHISDRIPIAAWLIVICELCERFAFYGLSGPFQNYIQFHVPGPNEKQPGALNRGQQTATLLTTFFQFFGYLTPIAGAIIADQFWGKYKTIFVSCLIYLIGLSVLVLTSIPPSIQAGVALPGLIVAMIILGIGTGGVKSNVSPLMADQYTRKTPIVIGKIHFLPDILL
jgi:POT family proton-dependent oligopeptide transporter